MDNLISVIVPVYNVKEYIAQCLESIISQTYKEIEIIIVDDGSTDGSGEICDYYAKKDSRIQVVHQLNGGAANAKNTGLRIATGEYLAFVDGDDYLEQDAYEFMCRCLKRAKADVIHCAYREVYTEHIENKLPVSEERILDTISYLKRFTSDWTCSLLWNKLYRREIFQGVFFEEGHRIDDEFFTYQGIFKAKKIICVPKIVYNYRRRKSSVMMSGESKEKLIWDKLEFLKLRREKVIVNYPELRKVFDMHYLEFLLLLAKENFINEAHLKEIKKLLKQYMTENERVGIPIRLYIQMCKLQVTNIKKVIKKNSKGIQRQELNNFFE